jgi:diaminohydroxyphosphoribosylaminopyrimidine deaminase/5-amino-6-(5-phosphoribosylamino)uracil reductase
MSTTFADPESVMRRAIELAVRGLGHVEPNPPVGAVLVGDRLQLLGEGWHEKFGGPHAEVNAIIRAGEAARGSTLYVTLEPCCRQGKTGPCSAAVTAAGIRRVVIGALDPTMGQGGVVALEAAGIEVQKGLLEEEATAVAAPFLKRAATGLPFVHAKWAMTLDGKIASRTGDSRWISNEASRAVVHTLRGRMDAIIVGAATAKRDDPLLTARPPGPRTAVRIVVDSEARLRPESKLVQTSRTAPVLVAALATAPQSNVDRLEKAGVEVLRLSPQQTAAGAGSPSVPDLLELMKELGRREMSNVLIEGGGRLLGSAFDARLIDAVHVFIGPKLVGGAAAPGPIAGVGLGEIAGCPRLKGQRVEILDGDLYVEGRVAWGA